MTDDLELLRAYSAGADVHAFSELIARHESWILASARRRLGDHHLAEDVTQAVFIVLEQKAASLVANQQSSSPPPLSAWLFHVMHLTCSRARRTRDRAQRLERVTRPDQEKTQPPSELISLMEDAIAQLPPIDRELVVRRFYRREDFETVGKAGHITAEAARKRVSRALIHVREVMLRDGFDLIPDELLNAIHQSDGSRNTDDSRQCASAIAKGAMVMMQQMEAIDFSVMSAEFFVSDVEANLDFFETLGFRRHWIEAADAAGRVNRASLRGGTKARLWLRRATETEGTRPTPGVSLFFWINGGADALAAHRKAIADQGVKVSPFSDDITLRNFTVASPDGYKIGFFTSYK